MLGHPPVANVLIAIISRLRHKLIPNDFGPVSGVAHTPNRNIRPTLKRIVHILHYIGTGRVPKLVPLPRWDPNPTVFDQWSTGGCELVSIFISDQDPKLKGQKPRISRSVKICESLGKPIVIKGMKKVMPDIDSVLLSELEHVQLCKVLFVYFRIRPNTKLSDLALSGALLSKWYDVLTAARKGRERAGVTLKPDFSDVDRVAGELGWTDSWLAQKKQKGKGKGTGMTDDEEDLDFMIPNPKRRRWLNLSYDQPFIPSSSNDNDDNNNDDSNNINNGGTDLSSGPTAV